MLVEVDGRRLRKQQNREAVLDALVSLFKEGRLTPTAADIAERAGISERSLFRYFVDVDDLVRAGVERQLAAIAPYRAVDCAADEPTDVKIQALVDARVRMHESVRATARVGRLVAHRHPVVAAQLGEVRRHFRKQVKDLFASELRGPRRALLPAVDALMSFETYDFMRAGHGMSKAKVTTSLVSALSSLLDGGR